MSNKLSGTLTLRLPSGDNRFKAFFNVGESGFATEEYVKQLIAESEKKEEGKYVEKTDIQDTLNSDNSNKPLSANQGKVLKRLLDAKVIEAGAVPMDTEPTEGNVNNVVSSDSLAKEFNKFNTEIVLGGVYDVSAHNNGAVFESLQALLNSSNLSTLIPTSVRHGGMSIRFIQGSVPSSDNKYVQYRLMTNTFSTDEDDWQGVDDEPTAGSENLVKSGGVANKISELEAKVYIVEDITIDTSSEEMVLNSMIRLDGSTWNVEGYCHTQKIDIEGINTISYNNLLNANTMGYIMYDANNNVIGSNTDNTRDGVLTIADYQDAKYVLFNGTNSVISGRMSISYSKLSTKTKMEENSENIERNTEDIKNNAELINLVNGKLYQTAVVQKGINSTDIAESNKGVMIRVDGSTWNAEGYCNTGKISTDNIASFSFSGVFGGTGCGWIIYDAQNNVIANNVDNATDGTIEMSAYANAKYILFNGITRSISILYYEQSRELITDSLKHDIIHYFYCGSTRQYKKIKDAIAAAVQYMDSVIYLDAETFDIVAEYGQSYLDSADANEKGIVLYNRVKIVGASGSKIVFNYTGSNTNIHTYFSVFNADVYGFTLENVTIESKNCRYSVHDERGSSTDAYHNHYINCRMRHDSSETSWGAHQAIGGGTGCFGEIVIDGGYYESVGGELPITYHLSGTTRLDAKCDITIKNVYINGGTVVWNYGASTTMSRFVVNGCKMAIQPEVRIDPQYPTNVELIAWGNSVGL